MKLWIPRYGKPVNLEAAKSVSVCPRCGHDVEMKTSSPPICGKCGASMPHVGSVGETVLSILRTFDNGKKIQLGTSAPYYDGHADGIAFALVQLGFVTRDEDGTVRLK